LLIDDSNNDFKVIQTIENIVEIDIIVAHCKFPIQLLESVLLMFVTCKIFPLLTGANLIVAQAKKQKLNTKQLNI